MKKIFLLPFLIVLLCLTGCSSDKNPLEGYWIADIGDSLAFTSETEVVIDNEIIGEYSIYDDNKLLIKVDALVAEIPLSAEFSVAHDTLTLRELNSNNTFTYFSEKKLEEQRKLQEEKIEKIQNKIYSLVEKTILPEYKKLYPNASLGSVIDNITLVDNQECYVVRIFSDQETHISTIDFFAINPETQTIYIQDFLSGEYTLWSN